MFNMHVLKFNIAKIKINIAKYGKSERRQSYFATFSASLMNLKILLSYRIFYWAMASLLPELTNILLQS